MSRIDSDSINLGESFVFNSESARAAEENRRKALSIIQQAQVQAQEIVDQAKNKAEQEALAVADAIREEATKHGYQEGFERGYQEGLSKLNVEMSEKVYLFNGFVESAFDIKKRIIKSLHLEIVNLVGEISKKVCQKQLEIDDEVLLSITKAAIGLLKEKETVTIIVNPIMRDAVMQIAEQIKDENKLISNIKIVENVSLSPDGTIVEGLSGRVDGRISSQIDEIVQKLLVEVQVLPEEVLVEESEKYLEQAANQTQDVSEKNSVLPVVQEDKETADSDDLL